MRAFIVRPFGIKKDLAQKEIDFERVERELIGPVLTRLGISGRTTAEILEAGNIRTDMFQRLLTADLVIADLSIHNANVFYELGVRHALRDKRTFLLRCDADEVPFDLKTDRYLSYDRDRPAAVLDLLVEALQQTIDSEDRDSPVFALLPELMAQDAGRFLIVPREFREDVERAANGGRVGDLELFAIEASGLEWENEGLRLVGRGQVQLNALPGGRLAWEAVRRDYADDVEANLQLGTIYEKLGDPARANQAIQRVLDRPQLDTGHRSEAYSLLGRNKKNQWTSAWWDLDPLKQRQEAALGSPLLLESLEAYEQAFTEDRNHCYSALNALAMCTTLCSLARLQPAKFTETIGTPQEALRALAERDRQSTRLATGVELALLSGRRRLQRLGTTDTWLDIRQADLSCLTSNQPGRVAAEYQRALVHATTSDRETVAFQLDIYERLGILVDNVRAALRVVRGPGGAVTPADKPARVLLFTGHRIDGPSARRPRFPPEKEGAARDAIKEEVQKEQVLANGKVIGIAGGASGGDILFHEVCAELGVATELYLAMPPLDYVRESVQPAGPTWVERFHRLLEGGPHRELGGPELPRWLRRKPDYSIWQRNNLWMLCNALAHAGSKVTLIALWDGEEGEAPDVTKHMVQQTQLRGVKTIIRDTKVLFGLQAAPPSAAPETK